MRDQLLLACQSTVDIISDTASKWQQLFIWHSEVPQVPEDPEHQADEDEEGPGKQEEIPKVERSKDAQEEED